MAFKTLDGNEAVARVAYKLNEVIAIYPITPASPMSEWADAWQSESGANLWGTIPLVVEMQSEGGAAGAIHGALQTGSLATTFTSSQGLLLMIPSMYKIAGELTPVVFHIAARALATQALSIFGDHSDVMATRGTGFAILASNNVQEAQDLALIAHAATLESRVPFLHFFDGFRTSHEISKIDLISEAVMKKMIDEKKIAEHRSRALTPDKPVLRGTSQNPDVFFQSRETVNPFYAACPGMVEKAMDRFAELSGRSYRPYEYYGAPDAEKIIVVMGSACDTVSETLKALNSKGAKTGLLKVRLYRPFDAKRLAEAIPASVKKIAVLDRVKEPGAGGEPLYLDCVEALYSALMNGWGHLKSMPLIIGGRYGLSSKEFTPAMVKAVYDHLDQARPKNQFTVGINDDLSHTSLDVDAAFCLPKNGRHEALFYGLGADGTVSANKNSIKIIGENSDYSAQGYFVYDSKKSGAITISHLRFGPGEIHAPYLVTRPDFIGCHQPLFLDSYDLLADLMPGGVFLLNSPASPEKVWDTLPAVAQKHLIEKKAKFYTIDAYTVAKECGMVGRINTVMQSCFFAISGVLPRDLAIQKIKQAIVDTYGKKGGEIVETNIRAVDQTLSMLHEVKVPAKATSARVLREAVQGDAPAFVRNVLGKVLSGCGDQIPVSVLPVDGTYPVGTAKYEKRNLAHEIPVWESELCIQCAKCVFVCPHSVIRMKAYDASELSGKPETFKAVEARNPSWLGKKFTLQVAPEDCTGCGICVDVCPAKSKSQTQIKAINMRPQAPVLAGEKANWDFFLKLPIPASKGLDLSKIREQQIQEPLFEFSGACAGCGETPYLKLLSQLFGDRSVIANATGCSSIYGGNLPTTPWSANSEGRGPAWCNSLFEDNAEFGLGMRLSIDKQTEYAQELLKRLAPDVGTSLADAILASVQTDEAEIYEQRLRVEELKNKLKGVKTEEGVRLLQLADKLVKKSVWIVGGDGWAYDIGFGGLDHVLSVGANVNILVLDTEVYSNTGGQKSKSTPRGAVAKFAAGGKGAPKKDLGLIAMTYGNVYVASVAMGAKDEHTLKAFIEAEAYPGTSLIIAYSHCIAHGINMTTGMQNQKAAFESGRWPLYRYNPARAMDHLNPLQLEKPSRNLPMSEYVLMENRFKMLFKSNPEEAKRLVQSAQKDVDVRRSLYEYLASRGNEKAPVPAAQPLAVK